MVKKLPDEKAGQLFKLILAYVNDENPTTDDILLEIAFEPIKQSLKQDLKKWESIVERNKSNGSKGGRPRKEENPQNPVGYLGTQENPKKPKKAVFVFDNDIDNDNDILLKKETKEKLFDEFWELYQKKVGKPNSIKEWNKLTLDEMEKVIEVCPNYIKAHPDPKYRKDPERFLKNKCWNDEIILTPSKTDYLYPDLNKNYKSL